MKHSSALWGFQQARLLHNLDTMYASYARWRRDVSRVEQQMRRTAASSTGAVEVEATVSDRILGDGYGRRLRISSKSSRLSTGGGG